MNRYITFWKSLVKKSREWQTERAAWLRAVCPLVRIGHPVGRGPQAPTLPETEEELHLLRIWIGSMVMGRILLTFSGGFSRPEKGRFTPLPFGGAQGLRRELGDVLLLFRANEVPLWDFVGAELSDLDARGVREAEELGLSRAQGGAHDEWWTFV